MEVSRTPGLALSPQSEAVTSELQELSLQPAPDPMPLQERKNGETMLHARFLLFLSTPLIPHYWSSCLSVCSRTVQHIVLYRQCFGFHILDAGLFLLEHFFRQICMKTLFTCENDKVVYSSAFRLFLKGFQSTLSLFPSYLVVEQ